ncbi:ferritin family protein [Candidatus Omnitrophota bacterium]
MRIEEKNGNLTIIDFNEFEADKIACKIEKDGIHFYKKLQGKVKQDEIRQALGFLIKEEEKHLKIFQDSLFALEEKKGVISDEDTLLDAIDYGIYQPYQNLSELENILDKPDKALKLGLVIEEKSINFYKACIQQLSNETVKNEISNIIEEEYRHKQLLEGLLENLPKG